MNIKHLLVYLSLGLTVLGVILRSYNYTLGNISLLTGLLYLCLYYLIKTIKEIRRGSDNKLITFFQLLIALMSIVIGTKYMYTTIGYYLGLVMIPLFVIYTVIYWIKTRSNRIDLSVTTITYIILTIPMFVYNNQYSIGNYYPQQFIKQNHLNLNNTVKSQYSCESGNDNSNEEALKLSSHASVLFDEGKYDKAIEIYRQAISIEPLYAHQYFGLSMCYLRKNQYDQALLALDSAILLYPNAGYYYNMRGLIYYNLRESSLALNDIEKSLALDSTAAETYMNQAIVYLNLYNDPIKAYESIKKAELYDYEFTLSFSYEKEEIEKKLAQE